MIQKPNILIAGTGAIGGYFGAFLAVNKNLNVCFLARGKALKHFKKNSLVIKSTIHKDIKVKINLSDKVSSFGKMFDYVFFCTKSKDTEPLMYELGKFVHVKTIITTLQNGFYNYRILKKFFGKSKCLQGICKIGVEVDSKSVIRHTSLGFILIGESSDKKTKRLTALESLLKSSGIKVKIPEDFQKEIWIKFAWNSIFNTLTGIFPVTVDKLFSNYEYNKLVSDLYNEIKKVAKSYKVTFDANAFKRIITDTKSLGTFKTSAYQDRLKNKEIETPYFTSELIRMAKAKKINIPVITYLHYLSKAVSLFNK